MSLTSIQLVQYCQRIGYVGAHTPTLATLHALHALHPRAIPFECLNPWLGLPVNLEPAALFNKLITQRRGGYCFEQNGLMRLVLETLGFSVQPLAARVVWNLAPDAQPPRTHQILLVQLHEQEWLVDVGFGGLTPLAPLRLVPERIQSTALESFRLRRSGGSFQLEALLPGGVKPMYQFLTDRATPGDFLQSNWFLSTYPESRFVRHLICTQVRGEQRHNLFDRDYTVYIPGQPPQTRQLPDQRALETLLRVCFSVPVDSLPALPARLHGLFASAPV